MSHFRIYIPTRTLFGAGMVKELHNQQLPGKKAMIVISNGRSTKDNGYLNTVEAELQQACVETAVFDRGGSRFCQGKQLRLFSCPRWWKRNGRLQSDGIHGHESRRCMGLHQWWNRKRTNDGKQAPTPGLHYHHCRNRFRSRSMGRYHQ